MNIVDYVIIGIIGISVLFGLYRGFIASVLNMGCGLILIIPAVRNSRTRTKTRAMAICQNCGKSWYL